MDVITKYGTIYDICLEDYCNGAYTLGYIEGLKPNWDDGETYAMFGVDVPVPEDPVWRFWVEFGKDDGSSQTLGAELSHEVEEQIKKWIMVAHPEVPIYNN